MCATATTSARIVSPRWKDNYQSLRRTDAGSSTPPVGIFTRTTAVIIDRCAPTAAPSLIIYNPVRLKLFAASRLRHPLRPNVHGDRGSHPRGRPSPANGVGAATPSINEEQTTAVSSACSQRQICVAGLNSARVAIRTPLYRARRLAAPVDAGAARSYPTRVPPAAQCSWKAAPLPRRRIVLPGCAAILLASARRLPLLRAKSQHNLHARRTYLRFAVYHRQQPTAPWSITETML